MGDAVDEADRATARRPAALPERHVVVVGAGVGGLVSALLLACEGVRVTLVERAAVPGGKIRQLMAGGVPVDAGPTVFTMRWVFEQIFQRAGASLADHLALTPLDVLARHAWAVAPSPAAFAADHFDAPGARLDLYADAARSADAIARFSSPAEARRFLAFCRQARRVYDALEGPYIRSQRPSPARLARELGPRGLGLLAGLGPFATLWRALSRHFTDPRLRQLFGRYATYCGSSPFEAPATLVLIAQVEMDGVWSVGGGVHALARALAELAVRRGVELRLGTGCTEVLVRDGRACGVRLAAGGDAGEADVSGDGETLAADAIVFNGDPNALAQGLLGDGARRAAAAVEPAARSLSALTWALNAPAEGFPLLRHNVFFDADYEAEFRDIFRDGRLPRHGTVYVCAQDRGNQCRPPQSAAGTAERLLCLVNAPPLGDRRAFDPMETEPCERNCFDLLKRCGLSIRPRTDHTLLTTPAGFHRLFPATGGALYGTASRGWMDSFRRPGSASRLPGLYLAGGGVHPGPGVPMAALSGQLAAATLMAHLDSTRRSHPVRISGGMSTRSATTAGTA